MSNNREKLKILIAISDKLWEDYSNNILNEDIYFNKMLKVKKEMDKCFVEKMQDIEMLAEELGYLIIANPSKIVNGLKFNIVNKN